MWSDRQMRYHEEMVPAPHLSDISAISLSSVDTRIYQTPRLKQALIVQLIIGFLLAQVYSYGQSL